MTTHFSLDQVHQILPHHAGGKNRPPLISSTESVRDELRDITKRIGKAIDQLYAEVDVNDEGEVTTTSIDTSQLESEVKDITTYDFDFLTECSKYLDEVKDQRDYQHKLICDVITTLREASTHVSIPPKSIEVCVDLLENLLPAPRTLRGLHASGSMTHAQYYLACQFEVEDTLLPYSTTEGRRDSHVYSSEEYLEDAKAVVYFNGYLLTFKTPAWVIYMYTENEKICVLHRDDKGLLNLHYECLVSDVRPYFMDWLYPTKQENDLYIMAGGKKWVDISPYVKSFTEAMKSETDI